MTSKTVRKDIDFLNAKKKFPKKLSLAEINQELIKTIKRDVRFLKKHNLIDYSLLVAVERTDQKFDQEEVKLKRQLTKLVCSDRFEKRNDGNVVLKNSPRYKKQATQGILKKM